MSLLEVQTLAGNRAAQALMIQRDASVIVQLSLSFGSKGPLVADLQQKLNALGARPALVLDGLFGPKTRRAVQRFQRAHAAEGLVANGVVDDATSKVLGAVREIDASEKELGKRIAQDMSLANQRGTETSGLYYAENYRRRFGATPTGLALRPEDYDQGYASPVHFDRIGYWDWRLKEGQSASQAVRAFLRGLTIAECSSVLVAIEMDAVRASLGDDRFDELYGSSHVALPVDKRLHNSQETETSQTSATNLFVATEAAKGTVGPGTLGHRNVKVGEWYYFQNHPQYPSKHPGGSWSGENAVYLGVRSGTQRWSGFGAENVTERYMLSKLIQFYNKPAPTWSGSPKTIDVATLLAAGGGLQLNVGVRLDADKVRALR